MRRDFWLERIDAAFRERSVVWLSGVRRAGKTTLAKTIPGASYHDCELVRVRRELEDPEYFFSRAEAKLVVLDEVHRLPNPSEVLKVAADHFPTLRVLATGSSTLAARSKFRDTLTGRKSTVWLTPMLECDRPALGARSLDHRMVRGGLPPFYLAERLAEKSYEEWIDSYWAKDLSELFVVEKRASFMKFVELLFLQSGGLFEAQSFATPCEVTRPTIQAWLTILETTLLATVLRPYHKSAATELRAQPKVYAFDTGFVCYFKGIDALRDDDRGLLLEHLVLGEIAARAGTGRLHHWRDKQKHEVDFVLEVGRKRTPLAIECKSAATRFDPTGLRAFRKLHPHGENWVVTLRDTDASCRRVDGHEVTFVPWSRFGERLEALEL